MLGFLLVSPALMAWSGDDLEGLSQALGIKAEDAEEPRCGTAGGESAPSARTIGPSGGMRSSTPFSARMLCA